MVDTQQVVRKICYACHNIKDKAITRLYAEKQLRIDSYILCDINSRHDKVNHLAKAIGYLTQSQMSTVISYPDITNPYHPKSH
jgi:hypothetical protein